MAKKEIREILAASLKALMKTTPGMESQPKVAARSKVGQTTVGRILRADVMAEYETIDSLARAFGRTPEQLLSPSFADELLAGALGKTQRPAPATDDIKKKKDAAVLEFGKELQALPLDDRRTLMAWRTLKSGNSEYDRRMFDVWTKLVDAVAPATDYQLPPRIPPGSRTFDTSDREPGKKGGQKSGSKKGRRRK